MENNFEAQLRDKLNARSIEPSANAWERVKTRPAKRHTKKLFWYRMASVVVIGFLVYMSSRPEQEVQKQVVIKENGEKTKQSTEMEVLPPIVLKETAQKQFIVKSESIAPKFIEKLKQQTIPSVVLLEKPITNIQIKANEIAINLEKMQLSGTEITSAMLDSMIQSAHLEIVAERMAVTQQKTDANQLLANAEKDLDKSFKERILGALEGKIKIALGSRNQ